LVEGIGINKSMLVVFLHKFLVMLIPKMEEKTYTVVISHEQGGRSAGTSSGLSCCSCRNDIGHGLESCGGRKKAGGSQSESES
jgi:hypothetical protein